MSEFYSHYIVYIIILKSIRNALKWRRSREYVAAHLIGEECDDIPVWCWWADNAIIMVTFTPVLATLCRAAPGTAR